MKKITLLLIGFALYFTSFAQHEKLTINDSLKELEVKTLQLEESVEAIKKLKVSGYIQTQLQCGEVNSNLKVGGANENKLDRFSRIGVRRGRIKFVYESGITSGVFQLDITEKGVAFKDAYMKIKFTWLGSSEFNLGVFDRPFGNEIGYSSSRRESPERSLIVQTLFPDERDLGAMLKLQASKSSPFNFLTLEAGLFAGNGIKLETDNRRDFIGRLSANKTFNDKLKLAGGVSYYNGSVYQTSANVYTMNKALFTLSSDSSNIGKYAKREYFGIDGQFNIITKAGITQLRAEYIIGTQPGSNSDSKSPNSSKLTKSDTYIRNFSGGYVIFIQDIGVLPVSGVLKYEWYDPNISVSGNKIGLANTFTGKGDISYNTLGAGVLWRINNNLRLQAYYEFVSNEKTNNIKTYKEDLKDNVFTLRLQYKF